MFLSEKDRLTRVFDAKFFIRLRLIRNFSFSVLPINDIETTNLTLYSLETLQNGQIKWTHEQTRKVETEKGTKC